MTCSGKSGNKIHSVEAIRLGVTQWSENLIMLQVSAHGMLLFLQENLL